MPNCTHPFEHPMRRAVLTSVEVHLRRRNHPAVNQADPSARLSALIHGARSVGHAVRRQTSGTAPRSATSPVRARDRAGCGAPVRVRCSPLCVPRPDGPRPTAESAQAADFNAIAVLRVLTCSHLRARILRVAQVCVLIRNSASVECCMRGTNSRQGARRSQASSDSSKPLQLDRTSIARRPSAYLRSQRALEKGKRVLGSALQCKVHVFHCIHRVPPLASVTQWSSHTRSQGRGCGRCVCEGEDVGGVCVREVCVWVRARACVLLGGGGNGRVEQTGGKVQRVLDHRVQWTEHGGAKLESLRTRATVANARRCVRQGAQWCAALPARMQWPPHRHDPSLPGQPRSCKRR